MTNPNNAVGTNGAFNGRTSVNAFNDVMAAFGSRGILSGWAISPNSGMTIAIGGSGITRDAAVAEDNAGNKTSINNISQAPISLTIAGAPVSNSRIDAIVAYVDNPPTGAATVTDNYGACGLLDVQGVVAGTPTAPDESTIRTAITADGASGTTAYYAVLGYVTVGTGTTDITADMITAGPYAQIGTNQISDGSVTSDKIDWTTMQGTLLFSGDAVATTISLAQSVDNFRYIVFLIRSAVNDSAPKYIKIPTRSTIDMPTFAADRYRFSLVAPFMSANGAIGTDCVQYVASNDGLTLTVKYQGYNYIGTNGATNVSQTTNVHVIKIYGVGY